MPRKDRNKKKRAKQQEEEEIKKVDAAEETETEETETEEQEDVDQERKDMDEENEAAEEQEDEDEEDVEPVSSEVKREEVKEEIKKPVKSQTDELSGQVASLSAMMSDLVTGMTAMARRVERMETGGANEFRYHQKAEDVERASKSREGIDERINKIVDTILGQDFGVALERIDDNSLGLLFTVNVPQRLSDIKEDTRPIMDVVTRQQKIDDKGNLMYETYWPGDRRSRAIPTGSSFDLIREHCERVRAYIVATYLKTNRPTPEFRIKH